MIRHLIWKFEAEKGYGWKEAKRQFVLIKVQYLVFIPFCTNFERLSIAMTKSEVMWILHSLWHIAIAKIKKILVIICTIWHIFFTSQVSNVASVKNVAFRIRNWKPKKLKNPYDVTVFMTSLEKCKHNLFTIFKTCKFTCFHFSTLVKL